MANNDLPSIITVENEKINISNSDDIKEEFLTICPRSNQYGEYYISPIPLTVIRDGIETKPDINIHLTELNDGSFALINYTNKKYRRLSFTVNVIIHKNTTIKGYVDESTPMPDNLVNMTGKDLEDLTIAFSDDKFDYKDFKLITLLDYWIRNAEPLNVVSKLIDVPNAVYYITDNKKRTQDYKNYTVWELTFTKKVLAQKQKFNKNTKAVTQAIKSYESAKAKKDKKKSKIKATVDTYRSQLKKCNYKKIVYTKTKKTSKCVTAMQQILYNEKLLDKKQIDGWYGLDTKKAVKKYQNKYKKLFNLKATGNLNKATYDTMCGVRQPVKSAQRGKTKTIKSTLPKPETLIKG